MATDGLPPSLLTPPPSPIPFFHTPWATLENPVAFLIYISEVSSLEEVPVHDFFSFCCCYLDGFPRGSQEALPRVISFIEDYVLALNIAEVLGSDIMSSTTSTATPPRHTFEQSVEEVKLSKTDLNKVIMDYLVKEGYPLAAQKFASEANMQPVPDTPAIQERVEIRDAIHSGDIQTAIEKINEVAPQLLDENDALHFSLRRVQLIEKIRAANEEPSGDFLPVMDFAGDHLASPAADNDAFLGELEQTMALLFFKKGTTPQDLQPQLEPSFRHAVAKRVNEALLESQFQRTKATLYDLINHRAWSQQKAVNIKKMGPEDRISLDFDKTQNGHANGSNGAAQQNGGGGDAMATEWEAE